MTAGEPRRVLVLAHDASRTGAPLLVLHLLEWAARHRGVVSDAVLRRGGPLADAFGSLGRVTTLRRGDRRGPVDLIEGLISEIGAPGLAGRVPALEGRVRTGWRSSRPDLVIVNGLGGAALLPLAPDGVPVAVLVHELDIGMARAAGEHDRARLWRRADRLVAVSGAVADLLCRQPGVDPSRVSVAHGFVEDRSGGTVAPVDRRRELGLAEPERPLVGAVGDGRWRKGIDLFVQLASILHRGDPPRPRLVWVGPVEAEDRVAHDLAHTGAGGDVLLTGPLEDALPWYPALDVMVSTAREDPFPLVGLEAGSAARPVVSFDSGGLRELLADGRGVVVPPLDVTAMAGAVRRLLADPAASAAMGDRLRDHVHRRHVTAVGAPRLWDALWGAPHG